MCPFSVNLRLFITTVSSSYHFKVVYSRMRKEGFKLYFVSLGLGDTSGMSFVGRIGLKGIRHRFASARMELNVLSSAFFIA